MAVDGKDDNCIDGYAMKWNILSQDADEEVALRALARKSRERVRVGGGAEAHFRGPRAMVWRCG